MILRAYSARRLLQGSLRVTRQQARSATVALGSRAGCSSTMAHHREVAPNRPSPKAKDQGKRNVGQGMPLTQKCLSTQAAQKKVVPFKLADIGEGIAEVELLQWFVREGDPVKQFDRVCEVQSDKATVEISSRYDGVVKRVHHAVGSMVKVGSALVDIEMTDPTELGPTINNSGPLPGASASTVAAAPVVQPKDMMSLRGGNEVVLTTPAVRRIAKENGVDLSFVRGTGPEGRVLKGDVLEFIKNRSATFAVGGSWGAAETAAAAAAAAAAVAPPALTPPAASITPPQIPMPLVPPSPPSLSMPPQPAVQPIAAPTLPPPPLIPTAPIQPLQEPVRVPIRGITRQMVKSMTASLKIPHFGYQDEVIMDKLVELRAALKPVAEAQGFKMSYLPLMVKAASLALQQFPVLNSSLSADESELIYHADHNIGVAMDTPKGLMVPVLRRVQDKSIVHIARELTDLQKLAATGTFAEEHLTGATFSLSNIGTIGGTYMDAKIVPPQVAIGAIGRIQKLPRFAADGTTVVPVHVMAISWAGDHRVVDGATMARFSNLWRAYLENPASMLAQLK